MALTRANKILKGIHEKCDMKHCKQMKISLYNKNNNSNINFTI